MKWFLTLCLFLTSISFAHAVDDQDSVPLDLEGKLKKLLSENQDMPALLLALSKPKEAQAVLKQYKGSISRAEYIGWLIQSEILFVEKKNEEALKLLKKFIATIEPVGSHKTWKDGVIPANYYLSIHPKPARYNEKIIFGSMSDSYILKRLIQFKEDELALNEYQRMMEVRKMITGFPETGKADFIIDRPVLYMNYELVIEYCNFLRSRNKSARARQLLLSELDTLDLKTIFESPLTMFGHHNYTNGKPRIRVEQFIKLSYGYFKLDNKLDELFGHLAQSKSKSALLIRAKIQAQLGNHDKALELAVKHAHTLPATPSNLAYRLGKTYHYFAKYEEAIVEFEKFIKLHLREKNNPQKNTYNLAWYQLNAHSVNAELQACYLATKNTQKLIQTKLTAILYGQHYRIHTDLETVKAFAIQSNHEEVYNTWAAHTLNQKDTSLLYKAHIAYVNGDIEQALDYSKQAALQKNLYDYSRWGEIYAQLGKRAEWIEILRELYRVAKDDQKIYAQRRLITYLRDDATDAEIISLYENVMASPQHMSEERNDGYSAADFKSKGHVSNRLLRLYHRNQMIEKFDALAIKIANSEKYSSQTYINVNDGETALSYYISKSSNDKIEALKKQLDPEKWQRTLKLIDWTLAGGVEQDLLNEPKNDLIKTNEFSVIASDQNVRDVVKNESYVFTAHPYGISVYNRSGVHHKRIFIPNTPHYLAANEEHLWIGTAEGVYQLDLNKWQLSRLALREKIPNNERELSLEITALAVRDDKLWIGSENCIRKYHTVNKTVQTYTNLELDYRAGGNGDWDRFMFQENGQEGCVVWVSGYDEATRRYDPKADTWMKTLPLIGISQNQNKDQVWLSQYVNKRLNDRPALFDEKTLTAKPCKISKSSGASSDWGKSLEELHIAGELDQQPVFYSTRGGSAYYQYHPETHELRALAKNWDVNSLNTPFVLTGRYEDKDTVEHSNGAIKTAPGTWLKLDDDTVLKGLKSSIDRSPDPAEIRGLMQERIGLHIYKNKKYSHRVSRAGIYGYCVFDVLETTQGVWVCSDAGLSLVTKEGSLIANYTTEHGLPEGRCTSAVEIDGICYFAFNGDYQKGGLAYLDPATSRFHRLTDVDGLSADRVEQLMVENNKLKIFYGIHSSAYDNNQDIKYATTIFDPAKMKFSDRSIPTKVNTRGVKGELPPMPNKLGFKIGEKKINSQTWLFGTQGIIIFHRPDSKFFIKDIPVKLIESKQLALHAQARQIINDEKSTLTLKQKLEHPNHYLREEALKQAIRGTVSKDSSYLIPMVIPMLDSPHEKIQKSAAELLFEDRSKDSINALLGQMDSKNERVKYLAVLIATKYSKKLPIKQLQYFLEPYRYRSSSEYHEEILKLLLSRGALTDKDTIRLLLKYPENANNGWDQRSPISYPEFSKTISNQPELIEELLKADHIYQYRAENRRFMYDLFREVDASVLPILHRSLKSDDRVVAANAALACAAIGDQSSIPELIQALKVESAVTQHSVITALSILKAKEAIPHLLSIDRILRQNLISRSAYNSFAMNSISHFESLENVDNSVTTNDEFQLPVTKGQSNRRNSGPESTTTLETTFKALKAIAPEKCQSYFREVITSSPYHCKQALILLKQAEGLDVKENTQFLNNLILPDPRDMKLAEEVKRELMKRN